MSNLEVSKTSSNIDVAHKILIEKLRWRSRRSMLELDMYFDRFLKAGELENLNAGELLIYDEIINLKDENLLSLFQGRERFVDETVQEIIDKIRLSPISYTTH